MLTYSRNLNLVLKFTRSWWKLCVAPRIGLSVCSKERTGRTLKWYHVELKSPTLDKDIGTSSSILKQLIIYLKIQGVSEVDVILAAEAVDLSATSATGEVELILHR